MAQIGQRLDFLGVNYYTRHLVADAPGQPWPAVTDVAGGLDKTSMGWEIYPEGLQAFLVRLSRDHVGALPLYVTENGMAWDDVVENGAVFDPVRIDYIERHMAAMKAAIDQGANLQGFYYWSLLDNYEWAMGYEKRFGLVHVDFATQKRTPKASYHTLARALAR
jgi:beta-glucosidase